MTGCNKKVQARQLCAAHYKSIVRNGNAIEPVEEKKVYNIGVIGTGVQGRRYIETMKHMEDIKLVGVSNRSGTFGEYNCKSNWKDLFDLELDGIIVATDPLINLSIIRYADKCGVPVLVEKPVSLYLNEMAQLKRVKIPVVVDYIHLFNPEYNRIKGLIKSNITKIASIGYNTGPFRFYNGLFDYMPHDLSMCLDLAPGNYKIMDKGMIKGRLGGMLYRAQLKSNTTELHILAGNGGSEKQRKLAIFCENGDQFVYDDKACKDYKAPLHNTVRHFIDVIGGKPCNKDIDFTVSIQHLLYLIGKQ